MSARFQLSRGLTVVLGAIVVAGILAALLLFGGNGGSGGGNPPGTYSVTFQESGLPSQSYWTVTLGGGSQGSSTQGSTTDTITFAEPDGLYFYTVPTVNNYHPSPAGGDLAVNGSGDLVAINFSGAVPLGTDFSWGIPFNESGVSVLGCGTPTTTYCYAIEIAGVGGGVSTADVELTLRNALGAPVAWATGDTVSLITPTSQNISATYDPLTSAWTLYPPFTGLFSAGDTIVISTPATQSGGLLGIQLVAFGIDGFSGTVPSNSFS